MNSWKISQETEQDIKFGYCTEFIIVLNNPLDEKEEMSYKAYLNPSEIRLWW